MEPPEPPFEQLLHHEEVVAAILRVLPRYGFRAQDLEDGRNAVWLMALEWKGERPTSLRGTKALCIVIAHRHGASTYRRKKMREKRGDTGLTDGPDEHLAPVDTRFDVVDRKKLLALLDRSVPGHTRELFEDVAAGEAQKDMAAERGIPYAKVRDDLEKGRKRLRNAILTAGMGALLVAGAVWLFFGRGKVRPPEEAHPTPSAAPSQVLVQEDPEVTRKKAEAAQLRQQAATLCEGKHWQACSDTLDRAFALDPAGDDDPAVETLRHEADNALMAKPDPIPTGRPAGSSKGNPRTQ